MSGLEGRPSGRSMSYDKGFQSPWARKPCLVQFVADLRWQPRARGFHPRDSQRSDLGLVRAFDSEQAGEPSQTCRDHQGYFATQWASEGSLGLGGFHPRTPDLLGFSCGAQSELLNLDKQD
ncbi:hypothetical protein NDU88_000191 [Pleurodeles waltl]|uniref:Uncharacterized protein n=1 Tax=Pleurodeles waltl TaxID=8319 RepID=A0AAV7S728_PLEWA|nr:hypothetical protein NDU88_000191 [Pleurodeles waltl]